MEKKMANEKKNKIINWLNFAITTLGIIAKVVREIIEVIPEKEEEEK